MGQLLRHLENKQGQRTKKGHCLSKGREVLKCGWGKGARGVFWEQVRLKRKHGPDKPGFAGPMGSLALCRDDQKQLKGLGQRKTWSGLYFSKILLTTIWPFEQGLCTKWRHGDGGEVAVSQAGD